MIRIFLILLTAVAMQIAATLHAADGPRASGIVIYVAPDGNDHWSGRLAAANADRSDGPLQSPLAARDAIRRARAAGQRGPVNVRLRGGTYSLAAPLVIEPDDSGTADAPVVYEAFESEKPVLSGGCAIQGFRQSGPLWEATIPEVKAGKAYFRQLFVNGKRRTRARSPNQGYYHIASTLPGPKDAQGRAVAREKFVFAPGDLKPWARLADVNVVLMHSWETSIHPLKSVDVQSNVVEFAAPLKEWWCIGYWEKNQPYYVENALELLDEPGEWYLNRETGVLSYWPLPGEKLGETTVIAPRLSELVCFAGNADRGRFVEHVTLRGLALHHADWELSPQGNSSTQAAVDVPAVVMADGALGCAIERCEVAHVGTYGIWFRRGCKDCRVQQNRLFDLGAGGIRVGQPGMAPSDATESSRNLVDNNHIYDGGRVYAAGIGVWVAQSSGNRIAHNDIHDLFYSGMSIGWNWDDAPNRTHHNTIELNHIHHCGHGQLSDMGLIYCLGVSPGSVIRNNVLHDVWPYAQPPLGWGIYLDGTCGSYVVENNLVYNTLSGGLMFNNGGHEHVIQNNIFALSANQAVWPYSEKRPNTFRHNIIYITQGELFVPQGERSLKDRLAAKGSTAPWDENVYWNTAGADAVRFYRRTFPQWQALGLDQHSRIADPLFVDPANHDFRLKPDSPALAVGFQPFEIREAGLYGDAAWVRECRHEHCPKSPLPPPPPPPKPVTVDDGFESLPAGSHPALATVDGEKEGASIVISGERAATGKQSLKVTDSKTLKPTWQPHFYYTPHLTEGMVREAFDVWLAPDADFFTEWRDSGSDYPRHVGPSVHFLGSGTVVVGGKVRAKIASQQWVHVEIEARLGNAAPRSYRLTVALPGQSPQVVDNLEIPGVDFRAVHWLGFSSTAQADTAFYLDNLKIEHGQTP